MSKPTFEEIKILIEAYGYWKFTSGIKPLSQRAFISARMEKAKNDLLETIKAYGGE